MKEQKLRELQVKLGYEPYRLWIKKYWTSRNQPLDFKQHKYLEQIYNDQSREIVYEKGAQSGFTERMITEALWLVDQFIENALYLFPSSGTVSDLVQTRIDGPINNNKYLSNVSGRAKKTEAKHADKVALKKMSKGFVFFRGSNSATQITSVPADAVFVDELDRMVQENVPYFNKRLQHSKRRWIRWASTPTIPNFGIDLKFQESDQHYCHLKCTHCGEDQVLDFFANVDQEKELLVCKKCRQQIVPWECEMKWIPNNPTSSIRGYHISQLYSPYLNIKEIIEESKKTSEFEVMQFFNQILGLPYEPKGAKISDADLTACIRDYTIPYKYEKMRTYMGIDVGTLFHYSIIDDKRLIMAGTCKDVDDLILIAKEYNAVCTVIDGAPEPRSSEKFARGAQGQNYLCWYTDTANFKKGEWWQKDVLKVNTGRTMSLDVSTNVIKQQLLELPKNLNDYPDFKNHLRNLIRIIRENKHGDKIAEYLKTGEDHFRHTLNYAVLARDIFNKGGIPEIFTF